MFITSAVAQQATTAAPGAAPAGVEAPNPFVQLLPFVFIFVIFYFLVIRPQSQARKKHMETINAVKKGDEVVTQGGIVGRVVKVLDGTPEVMVEIADKVQVKVLKQTLAEVRSKSAAPANDQ